MCAAGLALASAASAAPDAKPVALTGSQVVVDEQDGRFRMMGSLVGTWNTTSFATHYAGTDGRFVGSGTETFRGCLDVDRSGACGVGEPSGSLRFNFVYWATYRPGTKTLVRGQCVHPVIGGSGAFAKAKGVIHMTDVPLKKSGVRTTYTGTLVAPSIGTAQAVPAVERRLTSHTPASRRGGCGR
jgi:hypothetical protein